jgi:polyhydroxyalkanoate synthesis regulator phasin
MVKEALRGYLSLASGLTEITAARARATARSLVEQGEATAGQVTALAEDLLATSRRNRESLVVLVRHEVEQAVKRVGFGASSDVETLTTRVRELERTVRVLRAQLARPSASEVAPAGSPSKQSAARATTKAPPKPAKKAPAKKAPAKASTKATSKTPPKARPAAADGVSGAEPSA